MYIHQIVVYTLLRQQIKTQQIWWIWRTLLKWTVNMREWQRHNVCFLCKSMNMYLDAEYGNALTVCKKTLMLTSKHLDKRSVTLRGLLWMISTPYRIPAAQLKRTSTSPYFLLAFLVKKSCRLRAMQNILKGKVVIQHLKIIWSHLYKFWYKLFTSRVA